MTECPLCGEDAGLVIEGETDAIVESDLKRVCVEAESGCVFVHRGRGINSDSDSDSNPFRPAVTDTAAGGIEIGAADSLPYQPDSDTEIDTLRRQRQRRYEDRTEDKSDE